MYNWWKVSHFWIELFNLVTEFKFSLMTNNFAQNYLRRKSKKFHSFPHADDKNIFTHKLIVLRYTTPREVRRRERKFKATCLQSNNETRRTSPFHLPSQMPLNLNSSPPTFHLRSNEKTRENHKIAVWSETKKNNSRLVSGCPWTITRYTCGLNIGGRILHARKRVVDRSQQLNRVGAGGWGENVESSVSFFVVMGNRLTSIQTGNGTEGKMRIREARWRQNCEIHWRSILKIFLDVFFRKLGRCPIFWYHNCAKRFLKIASSQTIKV